MSKKRDREKGTLTPEEAEMLMAKGEPVKLGPPPRERTHMSLYHLRVDNTTLDGLGKLSLALGETPSAIARRILREGVAEELATTFHRGTRDLVLVQLDKLRDAINSQPESTSMTMWEPLDSGEGAAFEAFGDYGSGEEVE